MNLSTQTLASMNSRHPWRTIEMWVGVARTSIATMATLLASSLTTEGQPTARRAIRDSRFVISRYQT